MKECIFCKIVAGEAPCHKVWEDKEHLAFLSIYPNTPGVTIVVTKKHHPSYAFELPGSVLAGLVHASQKTALLLDKAFADVGRTGMIVEGFGVDHVHTKLYPMHGTRLKEWKPILSTTRQFFDKYQGYLSSNDCERADDKELAALAKRIRGK